MVKRRSAGRESSSAAWLGLVLSAAVLGRLARHWFMFALFAGVCLAIRGSFGLEYGLPYLFREDPPLRDLALTEFYRSPSFLTAFLGSMFAGAIWVFAVFLNAEDASTMDRLPIGDETRFFLLNVFLTGSLPVLALGMPGSPAIPRLDDVEIRHVLMGWLIGTIVVTAIIVASRVIDYVLETVIKGIYHLGVKAFRHKRQKASSDDIGHMVEWENIVSRVPLLWVAFLATNILITWRFGEHPVVAIFGLLGYGLALYVFMNFFVESIRLWILGAFILVPVILAGHERYKYVFPGLERYYASCDSIYRQIQEGPPPSSNDVLPCDVRQFAPQSGSRVGRQVTLEAAISHMPLAPSINGLPQKPKLVVVTASGGAYRATFWTALVLDRVRELSAPGGALEGMAQSIRLLTGASGGMITTAYMAILDPDEMAPAAPGIKLSSSLVERITNDIRSANDDAGRQSGRGERDSLSTVTQTLVQHDIFTPLWGQRYDFDRGRALEQQWRSLDVTFAKMREWEAQGSHPFIIVSPMIADTGQPLLISNLDLTGIVDPRSRRTFDLFKSFPDAPDTFKLATAVRMSATFPLVSPSVPLPTVPPVRVVDAGYFDNYGMSVALAYLKQKDVREWITRNTSGVIIIQINAYPVEQKNLQAKNPKCRENGAASERSWAGRAMQSMTSALEGLFTARQASMVFRNDQELSAVQEIYRSARLEGDKPFHSTR